MKTALVILADGFEEVEALAPVDFLRRAGVEVTTAGISSSGNGREIRGSHDIPVMADILLEDYGGNPDGVVIPGGSGGAANIAASRTAMSLIRRVFDAGGLVASICASPGVVLGPTTILEGRKATSYPGYEKKFPPGAVFSEDPVVRDGNLITSRGPGTALAFALEVVSYLAGEEKAREISAGTQWDLMKNAVKKSG